MKRSLPILLCALLLFGCGGPSAPTTLDMELNAGYDTADPFVHEKLFYVPASLDTLEVTLTLQLQGEIGLVEIADNETEQVLWSKTYNGPVAPTSFPVTLHSLDKEKEYVLRFTAEKLQYAHIVLTSDEKLVKERQKPRKPNVEKEGLWASHQLTMRTGSAGNTWSSLRPPPSI